MELKPKQNRISPEQANELNALAKKIWLIRKNPTLITFKQGNDEWNEKLEINDDKLYWISNEFNKATKKWDEKNKTLLSDLNLHQGTSDEIFTLAKSLLDTELANIKKEGETVAPDPSNIDDDVSIGDNQNNNPYSADKIKYYLWQEFSNAYDNGNKAYDPEKWGKFYDDEWSKYCDHDKIENEAKAIKLADLFTENEYLRRAERAYRKLNDSSLSKNEKAFYNNTIKQNIDLLNAFYKFRGKMAVNPKRHEGRLKLFKESEKEIAKFHEQNIKNIKDIKGKEKLKHIRFAGIVTNIKTSIDHANVHKDMDHEMGDKQMEKHERRFIWAHSLSTKDVMELPENLQIKYAYYKYFFLEKMKVQREEKNKNFAFFIGQFKKNVDEFQPKSNHKDRKDQEKAERDAAQEKIKNDYLKWKEELERKLEKLIEEVKKAKSDPLYNDKINGIQKHKEIAQNNIHDPIGKIHDFLTTGSGKDEVNPADKQKYSNMIVETNNALEALNKNQLKEQMLRQEREAEERMRAEYEQQTKEKFNANRAIIESLLENKMLKRIHNEMNPFVDNNGNIAYVNTKDNGIYYTDKDGKEIDAQNFNTQQCRRIFNHKLDTDTKYNNRLEWVKYLQKINEYIQNIDPENKENSEKMTALIKAKKDIINGFLNWNQSDNGEKRDHNALKATLLGENNDHTEYLQRHNLAGGAYWRAEALYNVSKSFPEIDGNDRIAEIYKEQLDATKIEKEHNIQHLQTLIDNAKNSNKLPDPKTTKKLKERKKELKIVEDKLKKFNQDNQHLNTNQRLFSSGNAMRSGNGFRQMTSPRQNQQEFIGSPIDNNRHSFIMSGGGNMFDQQNLNSSINNDSLELGAGYRSGGSNNFQYQQIQQPPMFYPQRLASNRFDSTYAFHRQQIPISKSKKRKKGKKKQVKIAGGNQMGGYTGNQYSHQNQPNIQLTKQNYEHSLYRGSRINPLKNNSPNNLGGVNDVMRKIKNNQKRRQLTNFN